MTLAPNRFVRWPWLAALALASIAVAAPWWTPPPARGDVADAQAYEGRWRYLDGRDGREEIERAIDHAIDPMPFYAEPIAEGRLEERVGPFHELRFALDGDRLRFAADGWGPVSSRLGGDPVTVRGPGGAELRMTQRMTRGGRLVQRFEHGDAARVNTFALSGDRDTLWLSVRIAAEQLPRDVEYRLRYRRVSRDRRQANR